MGVENFIDKKEIKIGEKKFMISKIPAIQAQEIYGDIVKSSSEYGDIAMTFLPLPVALKLLSYAAYWDGNGWVAMDLESDINSACSDVRTLIEVESAMIRNNYSFLFDGGLQKVLEELRNGKEAI